MTRWEEINEDSKEKKKEKVRDSSVLESEE